MYGYICLENTCEIKNTMTEKKIERFLNSYELIQLTLSISNSQGTREFVRDRESYRESSR